MSYSDLLNRVEGKVGLVTRYDVVCYLIGFKGSVTTEDIDNINRLCRDMIVEE